MLVINFWREKPLRLLFLLGGGFLAISFAIVAVKIGSLSVPVILHFDYWSGIDLFGDRSSVWGVWFLGAAISLVNAGFAEFFFFRSRALSYAFLAANFLISILLFVAVSVMVTVN